jgi:hypothetical protein
MVKLAVSTRPYFITNCRLKINVNGSWHVFSSTRFAEKSVESVVSPTHSFIGWHLPVRLNSVLKAIKLPASVTSLDTGLAHVN